MFGTYYLAIAKREGWTLVAQWHTFLYSLLAPYLRRLRAFCSSNTAAAEATAVTAGCIAGRQQGWMAVWVTSEALSNFLEGSVALGG